jgi:hypothetical protein
MGYASSAINQTPPAVLNHEQRKWRADKIGDLIKSGADFCFGDV